MKGILLLNIYFRISETRIPLKFIIKELESNNTDFKINFKDYESKKICEIKISINKFEYNGIIEKVIIFNN